MLDSQKQNIHNTPWRSSVGFLETRTGTWTTELLGLALSRIGDEQTSVVLDQDILDLLLGGLVDKLLVVGDQGLRDGLSDGIDLGNVTTTTHSNSDVNSGESIHTGT